MARFSFWHKKQKPPEFYESYLSRFDNRKLSFEEIRFIVFDTETTGLDVRNDRILSIGAIAIKNNTIDVGQSFEVYVQQEVFNESTVPIHGIMRQGKYEKITEEEAVKTFLAYIGNAVLVGHHIGFDIAMINYGLKRLGAPKLKNKTLDTGLLYKKTIHEVNVLAPDKQYSLDELCTELKVKPYDRHKAAGDAFITAQIFLKICGRLRAKGKLQESLK